MTATKTYIGVEIGGTKLQLVRGRGTEIEEELRYNIDASQGAGVIRQCILEGISKLKEEHKTAAIGVGFGGPVDWRTGTVQVSHQVAGWDNFPLKQWLENEAQLPVVVDNDANTAAFAESLFGAGKEHRLVFYATLGSGVGGGYVIDKKIYHGAVPGEVEIGHVRLDKSGRTVESTCSGWAVNEKIRKLIQKNDHCLLAALSKQHTGAEALLLKPALEQGDLMSKEILGAVADDLAFAFSHIVHLFHPEVLVIGGGLSLLGNYLLDGIKQQLPSYLMKAFHPGPIISVASLNEGVVPIGALALAKQLFDSKK
ncbi:MAG TPA: ROK family protein [Chitinophagaceae bacterium]|nr:ROK family protein [Chitinophagaceae bacterium]